MSGLAIAKLIGTRKVSRAYQAIADDRMLRIECKARADGFSTLYRWLDERDLLIVKADRQEPLVILRLSLARQIVKAGSGTNVGLR